MPALTASSTAIAEALLTPASGCVAGMHRVAVRGDGRALMASQLGDRPDRISFARSP